MSFLKNIKTAADKQREKEELLKSQRNQAIETARWQIERHRDEIDLGIPTTLSREEFIAHLQYIQDLREWPQQEGWADNEITWLYP